VSRCSHKVGAYTDRALLLVVNIVVQHTTDGSTIYFAPIWTKALDRQPTELRGRKHQMSDKLDAWITAVAGSLALAVVLSLGFFASIGNDHNDHWNHDDSHQVVAALLFDHSRH
jgi:hypothetical protein